MTDAIFTSAVRSRYLVRNPCIGINLPKLPKRDAETMVVLDEGAIDRLADAMDDRYRTFLYTLAYTGVRWGEAVAIRRRRCVLLRRRLEIAESMADVDGRLIFGTPKSHHRRTVTVPSFLCDMLAAHLTDVPDDPGALVFTAPNGKPLRNSYFRRRFWLPAVERAGLPKEVTPHSLRHSCASMLIASGVPITDVQMQLGHASPDITLRIYSHMFERDLDRAAEALDERFRAARAAPADDLGRDGYGTRVVRLGHAEDA